MKIIIVCGSLEPGRDGVGDYSRRMAGELIRQGHDLQIIALNDKYIKENCSTIQNDADTLVTALRLAANLPWSQRINEAKQWIKAYNPEWLSLQYVPFSFHKKGLHFGLSIKLSILTQDRKLHIMFHELWVGIEDDALLKMKIWGKIQQSLVANMISILKPKVINTHARLYQYQLDKRGVRTELFPLFGNVPLAREKRSFIKKDKIFNIVIFGGIHHGAPIDQFTNEILEYTNNSYDKINMTFIGRCGDQLNQWVEICKKKGINVIILGEQPLEKISEVMQESTIGISTTPFTLYDKSGSVAVMNEHQLPILCVARKWLCKGFVRENTSKSIREYYPGFFSNNLEWLNENLVYTYNITVAVNILINKFNQFK